MTDPNDTAAPAWETTPAPPAWVLEQLDAPAATGWRNVAARRWRADLPSVFAPALLVLVDAGNLRFMRYAVDVDLGSTEEDFQVDLAFRAMQEHLDHEALPECVAPGCTERGAFLLIAAELGHLAGKVYNKGDEIRMCGEHAGDVMKAGPGLDQIAEWLRPDAEVLDPWAYPHALFDGLTDEQCRQKFGRLPRMLREGEPR